MSERPSGTVTFLTTDIEGSTRLWHTHHEAMKTALADHDRLVRTAIETHGGYVFSTAGDLFWAAFTRSTLLSPPSTPAWPTNGTATTSDPP